MKEYKRCKFCGMEMDKSSLKCPHCKKVQATNVFSNLKSDNLIIVVLIIIGILTCINSDFLKFDNLKSYVSNFNTDDFAQKIVTKIGNIDDFFRDDEFYDESDDEYENYYVEDLISDFDEDFDYYLDTYNGTSMVLNGEITDFDEDDTAKYVYLETYSDEYIFYICIPKDDSDDIDYINSYDIGEEISYYGTLYFEGDNDDDGTHYFSICDGYLN